MGSFKPLQHASAHVNRAVFLLETLDRMRELANYATCTLASGVQGFPVERVRLQIITALGILATLQVDFGLVMVDPYFLQPPHNLLTVQVTQNIADLRVTLTQLLNQLDSQAMVSKSTQT